MIFRFIVDSSGIALKQHFDVLGGKMPVRESKHNEVVLNTFNFITLDFFPCVLKITITAQTPLETLQQKDI